MINFVMLVIIIFFTTYLQDTGNQPKKRKIHVDELGKVTVFIT